MEAGFVDFVMPVQKSRSCGKTNEIKVLLLTILSFIQQNPVLISAFAGFVAFFILGHDWTRWQFSYKSTTYKYWE